MKVTDRRMFTPDGRLREEYLELETASETAAEAPVESVASVEPPHPAMPEPPSAASAASPALEIPTGGPDAFGAPSFFDLVAVLAEPASLYLGDLTLPDGSSAENLEMARLHIDLLAILRQRTAGNLSAQESAALDDLLYRLRLRYVQKRG